MTYNMLMGTLNPTYSVYNAIVHTAMAVWLTHCVYVRVAVNGWRQHHKTARQQWRHSTLLIMMTMTMMVMEVIAVAASCE